LVVEEGSARCWASVVDGRAGTALPPLWDRVILAAWTGVGTWFCGLNCSALPRGMQAPRALHRRSSSKGPLGTHHPGRRPLCVQWASAAGQLASGSPGCLQSVSPARF
jgi:hypothetical protein